GPAFSLLAWGLAVTAYGLPISGSISSLLNYEARAYTDLLPTITITKNYISLLITLVSFLLIARGANMLVKTLKQREPAHWTSAGLIATIFLSSVYNWLTILRPYDMAASDSVYFLPNWLVIITLIVPYLYLWCRG